MKGTASYLMKFLDGSQKRFTIPVYQRNYDWKKENCKQLFDDLVSVVKEGKDMRSASERMYQIFRKYILEFSAIH